MFDTPYVEKCEQKEPYSMEVNRFHGDREGTSELGITRRGGILSTGKTNERASSLATFKGRENLRRANSR